MRPVNQRKHHRLVLRHSGIAQPAANTHTCWQAATAPQHIYRCQHYYVKSVSIFRPSRYMLGSPVLSKKVMQSHALNVYYAL